MNGSSSGASVRYLCSQGCHLHCLGTFTAVAVASHKVVDAASTHVPFAINDSCKMPSLGREKTEVAFLHAYRAALCASDCVIGSR